MTSRTIIILLTLLLTFSPALADGMDLNGELVEAEASNSGLVTDTGTTCPESGDCDDTDDRIDPLDDDSDGDGLDDAQRRDFDTIDNAPEEKERGGDLDGDGYGDVLARVDTLIGEVEVALERCDDDVCSQVRANADKRHDYVNAALRSDDPDVHVRSLNAIEEIVEEDIATLTRTVESGEGNELHREALGIEADILATIARGDYRDEDSDDDGIVDALDPDDDGDALPGFVDDDSDDDGIPTAGPVHRDLAARNVERVRALMNDSVRGIEKSDIRRGLLAELNGWNETVRSSVADYVRNLTDLNGSDRGLAIAAFASGNERVRELRYDNATETLEVRHEETVRVLGFIRMNVEARSTVDDQGRVKTRFPWWAIGPRTNLVENPLYESETQTGTNPLYE